MRHDSHNHDRSNRHRNQLARAAGALSLLGLATWAYVQPVVLLAIAAAVAIAALLVIVPLAVINGVVVLGERLEGRR